VLIADDHGIVREGLRTLLVNEGMEVVGEAGSGRQAVELTKELRPDVVLLDIRMPDMDGLQALCAIKAACPETRVIILTTYANPQYLARAVASGAAAYLCKEIEPERIPRCVRAVAQGEYLIEPTLLQMALQESVPPVCEEARPDTLPTEPLTEREIQVLKLIVAGLSNEEIARTLFISKATVKTHIRHIFNKLQVTDRTQAALWAVRNGITP